MDQKEKKMPLAAAGWLMVYGGFLIVFSLYGEQFASLYRGKLFGLISFGLLDLLVLLSWGLEYFRRRQGKRCRGSAGRAAAVFLLFTVLDLFVCFYGVSIRRTMGITDSLLSSALLCAAFLTAGAAGNY